MKSICHRLNRNGQANEPQRKRSRGAVVLSFVCLVKDLPGKFDPKKAMALGIPKGEVYSSVKTVTNAFQLDLLVSAPPKLQSSTIALLRTSGPNNIFPFRSICTSLRLRLGPLFGKLTKGESVTLGDGTIVHPHQVIAPPTPGPRVLIVSCPSENFVQSLTSNQRMSPSFLSTGLERDVCIIHFSPLAVLRNAMYAGNLRLAANGDGTNKIPCIRHE